MKFVKKMQECPECGNDQFIEDELRGELRCAKCGVIIKESIVDNGQEWRAFDSDQSGPAYSRPLRVLPTIGHGCPQLPERGVGG